MGRIESMPDYLWGRGSFEPLESFSLPALNTMRPYVWTEWQRADEIRTGGFANWEKTNERESETAMAPEHPYELRCRPVLTEHLYIPIEAEDPNVGRPDPSGSKL